MKTTSLRAEDPMPTEPGTIFIGWCNGPKWHLFEVVAEATLTHSATLMRLSDRKILPAARAGILGIHLIWE